MTFAVALMFAGAALWPVTLAVAGLLMVPARRARARWARVLCFATAVVLVADLLAGLGLALATTYQ